MSFQVDTIPNFEKEAKRLRKKYASLNQELDDLIDSLEKSLHWDSLKKWILQDSPFDQLQRKRKKWWGQGYYLC